MVLLKNVLVLLSCLYFADAKPVPDAKSAAMRKARHRNRVSVKDAVKRATTEAQCDIESAEAVTPAKTNIWNGLSGIEAANVTSFLFAQKELNLTKTNDADPEKYGAWINTVLQVELMPPNKSLALDYMDGDGPEPDRYAHVLLDMRATVDPYFQDMLVGPLPVTNSTTYAPLSYIYTKQSDGKIRNIAADDSVALYDDWLYVIGAQVADITMDLWGGSATGLDNDTIDIFGIDPYWQDDGIIRWDQFWNFPTSDFDSETILPLGLFFKSNVTGRDPSKWELQGWLYNNIFYETTKAFRDAYFSDGFEKLPANVDGAWSQTDRQGDILALDERYPPTMVAPTGSRFSVNNKEKYIKWQDFEFYLSFTRDTGMRLYDVRYKGDRILYELGLQEALAHYAGNDPVQSGTSYLDTYYGFGPYSFELVSGYDCPAYATYLNSSFYIEELTHTHLNSICLFETDPGYPMQRHSSNSYIAATKNIFFTVRNVATVGNYDYQFSYEFYMDGSINVEVRASGYIQATYYAHNQDYGYHIHDALSGSMHDHVLNFKADFDILGTNNTMATVSNIPVSETYPWSNGQVRNTMKLNRSLIRSEDESKLNWAANSQTQFKVVNLDAPNKYGEPRGYRLLPSVGTAHLTIQNSSNLARAANWASHDLFVTKQKDTEQRSAHPYNSQDVYDPMIDYNEFFDGENITQTDIVVWFNLGMHHVPHTGDLPNTVFTTARSGLLIMPLNYLLGDPSRQTVNMVRIDYGGGAAGEGGLGGGSGGGGPNTPKSKVTTFGQKQAPCGLNFTASEADLSSYVGDVVVRKFPYDPNNPYYDTVDEP